jgi:hypothetical protein
VYSHHGRDAIESDDPGSKLKYIREINAAGFEVAHVIHRYGLNALTAFEVAAAFIDACPGLTNSVIGAGSSEFAAANSKKRFLTPFLPGAVFVSARGRSHVVPAVPQSWTA